VEKDRSFGTIVWEMTFFYSIYIHILTVKIQEFDNKCTILQYKYFTIKTLGL